MSSELEKKNTSKPNSKKNVKNKTLKWQIKDRKDDHIEIANKKDIESKMSTWLECVSFVHNALPNINLEDIDINTPFLKKTISAPIIFNALTGGTALGKKINEIIAHTADKFNLPVEVGSQRVAIEHPEVIESFSVIREFAPEIPIIANIGIPQIVTSLKFEDLEKIIDTINADALAIHLNALQESIQPEGETIFKGADEKISEIKDKLGIPLIIKETGSGISKEVAKRLSDIGINMIDVSGVGGTSWSAIEYYRRKELDSGMESRIGKIFWDWGIPTAASIIETRSAISDLSETKIIASGGIRTGLDIAKCIAIGANYAGLAKPMLDSALQGQDKLDAMVKSLILELKITMFLTSSVNLKELRKKETVILPPLLTWMEQRQLIKNKIQK